MTDTTINIENVYVTSGAEDLTAILSSYEDQVFELQGQVDSLVGENDRYHQDVLQLIRERDEAQNLAQEFVEANRTFSDDARVREEALEGRVQDLLDLNKTLRAEIREREEEVSNLTGKVRDIQKGWDKIAKARDRAEARVKNLESDLAAYRANTAKPSPYAEDGSPKLGSVWQLPRSHWGVLPKPSTWIFIGEGRYLSADWQKEQGAVGDEYGPIEDSCVFEDLHQYLVPHPDFY